MPTVSRDYEPQAGQWYEDLETEETFQVLSVDPDEEIIRIQWPDREIQEIDLDQWNEMDLELRHRPRAGSTTRRTRTMKTTSRTTTGKRKTTTGMMTRTRTTTTSTKKTTNTAIASELAA